GHAVKHLGLRHRGVVVGDDQELLVRRKAFQYPVEADDVSVIKRRVDLVEHVKRTGINGLQGKEKRQRGQCPLAAGEEGERLQPFAGGLRQDLDTIVERVAFFLLRLDA